MQTAAPQGAIGIQVVSYAEAGGALRAPLPFPDPPNTVPNRRQLRQAAGDVPYTDAQLQILAQGTSDTSAMLANLNSSGPSQIFTAAGETIQSHTTLYSTCILCNSHALSSVDVTAVPMQTEPLDCLHVFASWIFTYSLAYLSPITCLLTYLPNILGYLQLRLQTCL